MLINSMEQQTKRKPTPASWRPGVSGNPRGRPRKGNALTDAVRVGADPDELVDIALDLARNGQTESTRVSALTWLRDSGYTRPAERHEVAVGSPDEDDGDALAIATDAELDQLEDLERQRLAIVAGIRTRLAMPALDVTGLCPVRVGAE